MQKFPRVKRASQEFEPGWYAGYNEEYMNIGGPFVTREEAIAAGRHDCADDRFYICRASLYGWSAPCADEVMDQWIEGHDELWWEDGFSGFDGPKDAEVKARDDLQTILNDWFERHQSILPTATAFCAESDGEWIEMARGIVAKAEGV